MFIEMSGMGKAYSQKIDEWVPVPGVGWGVIANGRGVSLWDYENTRKSSSVDAYTAP